jgi:homocysteine S-methyltransferase
VEAGAEFAITQPVFDLQLLEAFLKRVEHCRIPVIAGIWPLVSMRNAEFMKNELRISVPDAILQRMACAASSDAARATGVQIAQEMLAAVRPLVQGTQLSIPAGRYGAAAEILSVLGGHFVAKA